MLPVTYEAAYGLANGVACLVVTDKAADGMADGDGRGGL
jgi:hypothetical protein